MKRAIRNEIGAVFVPVSDIERARRWYGGLLGVTPAEVAFSHICVIPMRDGSGLVLDSKNYAGPYGDKPIVHFNTRDIVAAHAEAHAYGVDELGPVTDGVYFTFKDPDGNLLMVADVPPAPRSP